MSRLSEFKEFYLRVVLPNKQSYRNYFNKANFDENIKELIARYQTSYGFNPFEENVSLENLDIKTIDNTFEDYSNSKGNGVPKAIINTHYRKFLEYEENVYFENLQELIDKIHEEFEEDNFIEKFQKTRIELNGNSRVASKTALFAGATDPKNDDWTFNIGSTKELQYHLLYRLEGQLHYGLKFSAYPEWRANPYPLEEVQPFINSYFNHKQEIRELLNDYSLFFDDRDTDIRPTDEDSLRNIKIKQGILLGKVLKVEEDTDGDTYIKGSSFLELIYDLQGKQFEVYKLIFSKANLIKEKEMNTEKEIQEYINLLHYKPQIILQGPPGTGKTCEAKRIARELLGLEENDSLESNEQFKLIQFHPSYSYEDFVRGIIAKPNESGEGIVYTAENKVLGEFAEKAHKSLQEFLKKQEEPIKWEDFRDFLEKEKEEGREVYFDENKELKFDCIKDNKLKYLSIRIDGLTIDNFGEEVILSNIKCDLVGIPIEEFSQKNLNDNFISFRERQKIKNGYWDIITNYFIDWTNKFKNEQPEPYVLIIDEINRANLSAVFGELIYALEYRGEAVESMYAVEEDNKLILPPNLYIIGTMNTADRSVGHIDYAIRRRFAFVNVLPKDLTSELGDQFESVLFAKVTDLFNTNLSPEFKKEDVQLGHSYFITKNTPIDIRWEYEIKPILLEYIKDGILIGQDIEEKINSLITV